MRHSQVETILAAFRAVQGGWIRALRLHELTGSLCVHSRIASEYRLLSQAVVSSADTESNEAAREKARNNSTLRCLAPQPMFGRTEKRLAKQRTKTRHRPSQGTARGSVAILLKPPRPLLRNLFSLKNRR